MKTKNKRARYYIPIVLMVVICVSILTPIAEARASNYIKSYNASIIADGNGKVSVWFDIAGVSTMEQIGSTTITVYENGSAVKTYQHTTTSSMMGKNKTVHSGSVTYSGVAGNSYYAIVTFYAGKQGGGDNRTMTTSTIKAK